MTAPAFPVIEVQEKHGLPEALVPQGHRVLPAISGREKFRRAPGKLFAGFCQILEGAPYR